MLFKCRKPKTKVILYHLFLCAMCHIGSPHSPDTLSGTEIYASIQLFSSPSLLFFSTLSWVCPTFGTLLESQLMTALQLLFGFFLMSRLIWPPSCIACSLTDAVSAPDLLPSYTCPSHFNYSFVADVLCASIFFGNCSS